MNEYLFFDEEELKDWTFNDVLFEPNRQEKIKTYHADLYEKINEYTDELFKYLGEEKIKNILDDSYNKDTVKTVESISSIAYSQNLLFLPNDIKYIVINMRIGKDNRCFIFESFVRYELEKRIFKYYNNVKNAKVICTHAGQFKDCENCSHSKKHIKIYINGMPCYFSIPNTRKCNGIQVNCTPK